MEKLPTTTLNLTKGSKLRVTTPDGTFVDLIEFIKRQGGYAIFRTHEIKKPIIKLSVLAPLLNCGQYFEIDWRRDV